MDEWLSQVYGTNSAASHDIEKTAQAHMLNKMAEAEGIDLSDLSDEEVDALSQEVLAQNSEGEGAYDGGVVEPAGAPEQQYAEGEEGGEEELQAKFAEADFLGRVMAHSYTDELQKIAAEGGSPFPPAAAEGGEKEKCEDCDKVKCECPAKEASGPVANAIRSLGGTVEGDPAPATEEVPDAVKLAFATLQAHGYIE